MVKTFCKATANEENRKSLHGKDTAFTRQISAHVRVLDVKLRFISNIDCKSPLVCRNDISWANSWKLIGEKVVKPSLDRIKLSKSS